MQIIQNINQLNGREQNEKGQESPNFIFQIALPTLIHLDYGTSRTIISLLTKAFQFPDK